MQKRKTNLIVVLIGDIIMLLIGIGVVYGLCAILGVLFRALGVG